LKLSAPRQAQEPLWDRCRLLHDDRKGIRFAPSRFLELYGQTDFVDASKSGGRRLRDCAARGGVGLQPVGRLANRSIVGIVAGIR
jgi:hypothetical protein